MVLTEPRGRVLLLASPACAIFIGIYCLLELRPVHMPVHLLRFRLSGAAPSRQTSVGDFPVLYRYLTFFD